VKSETQGRNKNLKKSPTSDPAFFSLDKHNKSSAQKKTCIKVLLFFLFFCASA